MTTPLQRTRTTSQRSSTIPRHPESREVVIAYVLNHPEKYTPLADHTDDPVQNEWASKRNGAVDFSFMKTFRRRCL